MVIRVVGAAIVRGGRVLAARRGPERPQAGLWEFPGGKVEAGETDELALARELREELGIEASVGPRLGESAFVGARGDILLVVYRCESDGEPVPTEHDAIRWLAEGELESVPWCPADLPVLPAVREQLSLPRSPRS